MNKYFLIPLLMLGACFSFARAEDIQEITPVVNFGSETPVFIPIATETPWSVPVNHNENPELGLTPEKTPSLTLTPVIQEKDEVVKNDGEVLSGTITKIELNDYIRIRTAGGKVFQVDWKDLKQLNGKSVASPTLTPVLPAVKVTAVPHIQARGAFYLGTNLGWLASTNSDLGQYTDPDPSYAYLSKNKIGSNFLTDLQLGYQLASPFGLELGAEFGPTSGVNASGNTVLSYSSFAELWKFYLMPTYRVSGSDGLFYGLFVHTLGLRLGWDLLLDSQSYTTTFGAASMSGNSQTVEVGLVYRLEQFIDENFSAGLDISYNFTSFNGLTITNSNSSNGAYIYFNPPPAADLSGLSAKASLNYWFNMPFCREAPRKPRALPVDE